MTSPCWPFKSRSAGEFPCSFASPRACAIPRRWFARREALRLRIAPATFVRDIKGRVMIPAYARPAHRRLREKLARILEWNEAEGPNREIDGDRSLGIITSGISFMHAREAAPEAAVLKLGMSYPLPLETIRRFAGSVSRCVVIEEGDPYLLEAIRAAGLRVEGKPEEYRFGELNVDRVKRILAGDTSREADSAARQAAGIVPGLPAPFGLQRPAQPGLHRGQ